MCSFRNRWMNREEIDNFRNYKGSSFNENTILRPGIEVKKVNPGGFSQTSFFPPQQQCLLIPQNVDRYTIINWLHRFSSWRLELPDVPNVQTRNNSFHRISFIKPIADHETHETRETKQFSKTLKNESSLVFNKKWSRRGGQVWNALYERDFLHLKSGFGDT